jgi:hypothetical protein
MTYAATAVAQPRNSSMQHAVVTAHADLAQLRMFNSLLALYHQASVNYPQYVAIAAALMAFILAAATLLQKHSPTAPAHAF